MSRLLVSWLFVMLLAATGWSQERGTPLFSDTFETTATFAENWSPKDKQIVSLDGQLVLPPSSTIQMRRETPLEFCVEMEVSMDMSHQPDKSTWGSAFGGFMIEGYRFMVLPAGHTWMIWKLPGWEKAHGKHVTIEGFEPGKPFQLTLMRSVDNGTATYRFWVNGTPAGDFVSTAPVPASTGDETYQPLDIFGYNVKLTIDSFTLYGVKHSADDSPNVIINSSFEHVQDGFPLYFCRGNSFRFAHSEEFLYEDYLQTWALDQNEAHSGKQSLQLVNDESARGHNLWAWGAGTVKGQPGVFSVWLKADRDDFPVWISYGKRQEVMVGTEWARYEVVNPELPGAGVYSPVTIAFNKQKGTLWIDDLQAEFLDSVDEADPEASRRHATDYRPSEQDELRFSQREEEPVRGPDITIPMLPEGVTPSMALDSWKDHAAKLDTFYFKEQQPRHQTEAYLACDTDHLYIGYRCQVDDLGMADGEAASRDSFSVFSGNSVEFFLDPAADGTYFQFALGANGTRVDIGKGGDVAWEGEWQSSVKANQEAGTVDYLITVPLATVADAAMGTRWLVNICRNDAEAKEHQAIAATPLLGYKQTAYWPYAELPAEVVARYSLGVTEAGYTDTGDGMTASLSLNNLTGRDHQVTAELYDAQDPSRLLGEQAVLLTKGRNDLTFQCPTQATRVRLNLSAGGASLADQTFALTRRNPVAMLGRLDYYMTEPQAIYRVSTHLPDLDSLTAVLTVAGLTVESPVTTSFDIAVPLARVPDGEHTARLTLKRGGESVIEVTAPLVKRPYRAGSTQVNHFTRSLQHDGEPVLPVSPFFVFVKHQSPEYAAGAVDWAHRYGFRFIHLLVDNRAVDQAVAAMERAREKGIRVILWTKYYERTDDEVAVLRQRLDMPNVLTQMVLDEPELGMASEDARAYLRKMRALFPYHPVHMNNTVLGIPNRYANLETDILMLDDYLTNRENRSVADVVEHADTMMEAGAEAGKPGYYFVVGGNFPLHHREPSYSEQIAQCYGNIATGVTGLSFFYGMPATQANWRACVQVNRELLALTDVLLSEERVGPAICSADPQTLRSLTRKRDGAVYVIACNIAEQGLGKVSFTLPAELNYAAEAEVMFEDRTVSISDGRFSDEYPGHTRHVYKINLQ